MVILSDDTKKPYSVIIGKVSDIRKFLYYRRINFDRIWIPKKADIEGFDLVLKNYLEQRANIKTDTYINREYILENFPRYNKEYSGFIKNKTKHVVCNMILNEPQITPRKNEFTVGIYGGGCDIIQVVFNVEINTVILIVCSD